jgi:hypothetical protein
MERFASVLQDQHREGRDPQEVAELIERVLRSSRPSARYPVGWAAGLATRARGLIPDRLFDLLARRPLAG